ncbi:MAG: hypothetical protein LKF96_02895 [Treponema sp.]|jgi:hypothetical protein|nr:hypothetical protein [Treponema sp.]
MDVIKKMKDYLDKGAKVSKMAIDKAGGAVQDLGDKSVVRIEMKQLETKRENKISELGKSVYGIFSKNRQSSLTAESSEIAPLIAEIKKMDRELGKRRKILAEDKEKSGTKK